MNRHKFKTWPIRRDGTVSTIVQIATLLKKLYGKESKNNNSIPLEELCRLYIFQYDISEETKEEDSLLGYQKLIATYPTHEVLTPEMDNLLATILGKKLPKNKGLAASYQTITKKIVGLDLVDDAVIRIKDLLAEARDIVQIGRAHV